MPNLPNGRLEPGSVHQLWITRGPGKVSICEVEPGYWREWVFDQGYNGVGRWTQRHSLDCEPRPCDVHSVHPRLREACRMALTW